MPVCVCLRSDLSERQQRTGRAQLARGHHRQLQEGAAQVRQQPLHQRRRRDRGCRRSRGDGVGFGGRSGSVPRLLIHR